MLHAQQRARGIADEEAHKLRLLELQREKLGLEAALLEEGSTAKIEKLIELANEIEAQIFEDKERRKDEFSKELFRQKGKAREEAEALEKAERIAKERAQEDQAIASAKETVDIVMALARTKSESEKEEVQRRREAFDEQSGIMKAAIVAQKAIAAIEIAINLQREIASYWASSASAGPAAPAIAIPLTVAAVARGAAALASIGRFERWRLAYQMVQMEFRI